jgi:hypothetical protein
MQSSAVTQAEFAEDMITEIKMPPREEVQIAHDVPRRGRKSRFLASSAALLVVLGIGWFAGAKTQDSGLLAQRLWHTAGAMLADLDARRRQLIEGIEAHVAVQESKSMERSQTVSGAEVVERVTGYLSRKLDQMGGTSDAAIRELGGAFVRLGGSVESSQRELLAKLDQVQARLDGLERQATSITNTKQTQLPEQPNVAPAIRPAHSVQPTVTVAKAKSAPKAAPKEPKKVEHWFVREVVDGVAVLEGPSGVIEVSTGDVVPGMGRVEAISERDGFWVIATNKGAITAR